MSFLERLLADNLRRSLSIGVGLNRRSCEKTIVACRGRIGLARNTSAPPAHGAKRLLSVPANFGGRDGPCITNKDTILEDIDVALGRDSPPDLEVILTEHVAHVSSLLTRFLHRAVLRFGHVAVRYTTSDGKQRVFNIMGDFDDPDAAMVNFVSPKEYIFGTSGFDTYAQQGGVYNRPFVGVRVERVAAGATDAMHAYFVALDLKTQIDSSTPEKQSDVSESEKPPGSQQRGAARFQLIEARLSQLSQHVPKSISPLVDGFANVLGDAHRQRPEMPDMPESLKATMDDFRSVYHEAGNCAQWTSSGMQFCGLLRRTRLFPKAILIQLLESEVANGRRDNVNVVYYEQVKHATPKDKDYRYELPAYVHPLYLMRNTIYSDMTQFASVVVSCPPGEVAAVVQKCDVSKIRNPPKWIQFWSGAVVGVPTLVLVGAMDQIGPLGPTAAAFWLGLNWWLY